MFLSLLLMLSAARADLASDLVHVRAAFDAVGIALDDGADWDCNRIGYTWQNAKLLWTGEVSNVQVQCQDDVVKRIWISRFDTLTEVPDAFYAHLAKLPGLKQLYIDHCPAFTSLSNGIGALTGLTNLLLQYNGLTSVPDSIGLLESLTYLSLYGNDLTSVPDSIGQLESLTDLSLGANSLTSFPDAYLQLPLTKLALQDNLLTSLPPSIGRDLPNLTHLRLQNNHLTSVPHLSCMTAVSYVYLQGNPGLGCVPLLAPGLGPFATTGATSADQTAIDGGVCPGAEPSCTFAPTTRPTASPIPTRSPTEVPTSEPTRRPTSTPTLKPSISELCEIALEDLKKERVPIVLIRLDSTVLLQAKNLEELRQKAVGAFGDAVTPDTAFSYTVRLPASSFNAAAAETEVTDTIVDEEGFSVAVAFAERTQAVLYLHIV